MTVDTTIPLWGIIGLFIGLITPFAVNGVILFFNFKALKEAHSLRFELIEKELKEKYAAQEKALTDKCAALEKSFKEKHDTLSNGLKEVEDNYWLVKTELEKEIKEINKGINKIDKVVSTISDFFQLLKEGKIKLNYKESE